MKTGMLVSVSRHKMPVSKCSVLISYVFHKKDCAVPVTVHGLARFAVLLGRSSCSQIKIERSSPHTEQANRPDARPLYSIRRSCSLTTFTGPVGMEKLTARMIKTFIGVCAKIVSLCLQQICAEPFRTISIVIT